MRVVLQTVSLHRVGAISIVILAGVDGLPMSPSPARSASMVGMTKHTMLARGKKGREREGKR